MTTAVLKLFPRPTQVQTIMFDLNSVSAAMSLYAATRRDLSDLPPAFELMPRGCIDLILGAISRLRVPLRHRAGKRPHR
jgi:FAD/FMN-containing dehydrogenase